MISKNVKRIILFGGELALFNFAVIAIKRKFEVVIFTNNFRLNSHINETGSLRKNFKKENIPFIEVDNLSKDLVSKYIDDNTIGLSIITFWLFKKDIIELFKGRLYNYHGARLPEERGGGIYTWRILSQTRIGGLTIHQVAKGIDTGDILLDYEFMFPNECRIPLDYIRYVESIENKFLIRFLDMLEQKQKLKLIPQKENQSLYWPLLNSSLNGFINWDWSVDQIETFINAFDDPYQGASTYYKDRKVHLKKCFRNKDENLFHPFQAGIIFRISEEGLYVATLGGYLIIKEVFDEKENKINDKIRIGYRFYTPYPALESAKKEKAQYGSRGLRNNKHNK